MDVEVVRAEGVETLQRAEIDLQVATARRYPRDELAAIDRVVELCTATRELAAECSFAIQSVDDRGRQVAKSGPSVRFAEVLFGSWGNLRGAARAVDVLDTEVIGQGVCFDLERNVAVEREVRRRIVRRDGSRYNPTAILETANAAASIAFRNAVLVCIPKPVWLPAYERVVAFAAAGAAGSRPRLEPPTAERRDRAVAWFTERGVGRDALLVALGLGSLEAFAGEHLEQLSRWRDEILATEVEAAEVLRRHTAPPHGPAGRMAIGGGR